MTFTYPRSKTPASPGPCASRRTVPRTEESRNRTPPSMQDISPVDMLMDVDSSQGVDQMFQFLSKLSQGKNITREVD
jgi:hypothetical protein